MDSTLNKSMVCPYCGSSICFAVEDEDRKIGQRIVTCENCGAIFNTQYQEWLEFEPAKREKLTGDNAGIKSFVITGLIATVLTAMHFVVGIIWLILGEIFLYLLFKYLSVGKFDKIMSASLKRTEDAAYLKELSYRHAVFPLTDDEKSYCVKN